MKRIPAISALLILAIQAHAQTNPTVMLPRGTWTIQSYAALAGGDSQTLISGTVGAGYYVFDHFSLNLEATGYGILQDGENTGAGGLQLMFRHHFILRDRWTIFADVGGSVFEAADRVPSDGTQFNFMFRSGLGMTWQLKEDVHLLAGLRYVHLSNARLFGDDRNPNMNGVEGYVGLMFLIK